MLRFLDEHFDDIGVRGTVDQRPEFQAAVLKRLRHPHGHLIAVMPAFDQCESVTAHVAEGGRIMTNDRQPAAPLGAIQCECPDDVARSCHTS
jgi:hypothetical protein